MYFVKQNIYCLSNVVIVFMWWTVYQLSFCRKVNRQYKDNLSCIMQTYRHPYRRMVIRRYLTESSKLITQNATNTDDITDGFTDNYTDGIKSVGISQRVRKQLQQNTTFTDGYTDTMKSVGISQRVRKTWHHHRRDYRRIIVRRHLTVSSKIFRTKCHNHRRIHRQICRR